jgi:hypothetical protein
MTADPPADLRRVCYLLLGALAVGTAAARVAGTENVHEASRFQPPPGGYGKVAEHRNLRPWPAERPEPTPFFGSNDRSRWATVRALVDHGTYSIGRRENHTASTGYRDTGIVTESDYQSIDRVMDPATGLFYSSKPPLFATLVAGEYWLLKHALGWDIVRDRWPVAVTILLTWNVLPFAVYLVVLAGVLERWGQTDFGRVWGFAVAALGTFVGTFQPTLNNHLPGTYCVLFALAPLAGGVEPDRRRLAVSGFFAGLAVTFELPAAALLAGLGLFAAIARGRAAAWFAVAAAVPILALFACNSAAFGTVVPVYEKFETEWYRYPGSHWSRLGTPAGKGIDFIDEPKWLYAWHLLVGHHGWFSLTPAWVVGLVGFWDMLRDRPAGWRLRVWSAQLYLGVSAVVVGFYVYKTNNYGGNAACARWLIWLTPLWVFAAAAGADRLAASRWGRRLAVLALAVSAFSAAYPTWNPWRPPWVQQLLFYAGMIDY